MRTSQFSITALQRRGCAGSQDLKREIGKEIYDRQCRRAEPAIENIRRIKVADHAGEWSTGVALHKITLHCISAAGVRNFQSRPEARRAERSIDEQRKSVNVRASRLAVGAQRAYGNQEQQDRTPETHANS